MNKSVNILIILLIAILFIFVGLFLSIKSNRPQLLINNYQLTISPTLFPTSTPIREKAKVTFILDGDTIELADKRRVRYIGIDSPEILDKEKKPQCFATESAKINKELVLGQEIAMEKDISEKDKYGRLLRYVYVEDILINDFLVNQGYAKVDTVPPDVKYSSDFQISENEAKEGKRGMWGKCNQSY